MSQDEEAARPTIDILEPREAPPAEATPAPEPHRVRLPEGAPPIAPPDAGPAPDTTLPQVLEMLHSDVLSAMQLASRLLDVPVTAGDLGPPTFESLGALNRKLHVLDGSVRDARIALGILAGVQDLKGVHPDAFVATIRALRAAQEGLPKKDGA